MELLRTLNNEDINKELRRFGEKHRISDDEVICSIVYEFANKLPYSIDYMDELFVPGMFLNVSPVNPEKYIFKYNDSLYQKMVNWGDTLKSGILLQICNIFQMMLMGYFPTNYKLNEDDFYNLGFSEMTSDEEYNRYLFETLEILPEYVSRLNNVTDVEERRQILDDIYSVILNRVGQRIGGFRRTSIDGDIITVQEHKPTIVLRPHRDLDMLYYFEHINYGFGIRTLIDDINKNIVNKIEDKGIVKQLKITG